MSEELHKLTDSEVYLGFHIAEDKNYPGTYHQNTSTIIKIYRQNTLICEESKLYNLKHIFWVGFGFDCCTWPDNVTD